MLVNCVLRKIIALSLEAQLTRAGAVFEETLKAKKNNEAFRLPKIVTTAEETSSLPFRFQLHFVREEVIVPNVIENFSPKYRASL